MKDFERWGALKKTLHVEENIPPHWKEREVWWCSIGVNVGHEEDGKNDQYNRPVLILKKFNKRLFWGIPLTTQIKDNPHYHQFNFKGLDQCAMLTQLRVFDACRLTRKLGRLDERVFEGVKRSLQKYMR